MHSSSGMGVNNVPAFLTKIWQLVDDPNTDELIAWDPSGSSFHVFDQARFAKEILPLYFKHNNMASFIRQLNMYGFRKVVHIGAGAIKCETDDVEFHHIYFVRGEEHLLENIKRKASIGSSVPSVKAEPGLKLNQEDVTRVLNDVQLMKGKQDNMSTKMDKMKKENEALWREVANLRNKHMKQQQIVNKLIQFMIHLVGGKSGLPGASLPKRKMPLMINDASQVVPAKRPRYNKQLSIEELQDQQYVVSSPPNLLLDAHGTTNGPIIQEVVDVVSRNDPQVRTTHSYSKPPSGNVGPVATVTSRGMEKLPATTKSSDVLGASLDSTDLNNLLTGVDFSSSVSSPSPMSESQTSALDRFIKENPLTDRALSTIQSPNDIRGHVDNVQDELDGLKDLLCGGSYNFDPSTLLNLFNNESSNNLPVNVENLLGEIDTTGGPTVMASTSSATDTNPNTISGNELVRFQPAENFLSQIADLSDIIDEDEVPVYTAMSTQPTSTVSDATLLDTPDFSEIDPMSFINTNSNMNQTDDQGSNIYSLD